MHSARVIIATLVAMAATALVLLPLPDSCDQPGNLVLCNHRASAIGLMFARNSAWPTLEALAALVLVALLGMGLAVRGRRRSARPSDD